MNYGVMMTCRAKWWKRLAAADLPEEVKLELVRRSQELGEGLPDEAKDGLEAAIEAGWLKERDGRLWPALPDDDKFGNSDVSQNSSASVTVGATRTNEGAGCATDRRFVTQPYARSICDMASYEAPSEWETVDMKDVQPEWRTMPFESQQTLGWTDDDAEHMQRPLYVAGDLSLLKRPCVSVVGTRSASEEGKARARRLARELVEAGVVVVSGLADGIDTNAHKAAIQGGGRTVSVVGTPLDRAYPKENAALQERIYREHLLVSPFKHGSGISRKNFPLRNKVMSALTDASVIVEAGETSGTIHQAKACKEQERWLFFLKSMAAEGPEWARSFLESYDGARVLAKTSDLLDVLPGREAGSGMGTQPKVG